MRPTWQEYFMNIAFLVSSRATCLRRKVGAVIVRDNQILTTGYNGACSGLKHCAELECIRDKHNIPSGERQELCRASHAESNAIAQAAKFGVSINRATLYLTNKPCITCAKLIIQSGIKTVVYRDEYPDILTSALFQEAEIEFIRFTGIGAYQ
jgi:dCMP deaminase